ncbi:MAG TPA: sigma 54-interacting transcriptional regulator [Kofleriaceae bacterium]|nr:sigma 54-interacting transcriptional regulator [Kofleriaceae bacterium]
MSDVTATVSRDDGDDGDSAAGDRTASLTLLLECDRPAAGSSRHLLRGIDQVTVGRAGERRATRSGATLTLGVPDATMSTVHARLVRELDRWIVEDAGSKNGVLLDGARFRRAVLADGDLVELGHTIFLFRDAPAASWPPEVPLDLDAAAVAAPAPGLVTFVPELERAFADLLVVARTGASVLVQGETGTGKELLARAVHQVAAREGAFVAVNCGALPGTLVESELFGHRRGAFTGAAQDRPGAVRSADGGTLFLDEIGDLPLPSQAVLLRVLQEREVTPLGSSQPEPVDLKVVAATHHDLKELVARDVFRRDLYARLAGYAVRLPPLRQRREDLGLLVAALLPRVAPGGDVRIGSAAARRLLRYDWPLNVRELEACLGVAAALARGAPIKLEHLPEALRSGPDDARPARDVEEAAFSAEDEGRRDELVELLRQHDGNVSAVARALGKARAQIHRWLRRYRIDPDSYRSP